MIIFTVALQYEAEPIIKAYQLKRDMDASSFLIYRGENVALIISGTGKLNAAIAVTYILSNMHVSKQKVLLCNWGSCASEPTSFSVGDTFVIHKITDADTSREYYPDLPLALDKDIPQNSVCCLSKPFLNQNVQKDNKNSANNAHLYDMESAGIMASATKFLSHQQILMIKVISDSGESGRINPDVFRQAIQSGYTIAAPWIQHAYQHMQTLPPPPESAYEDLIMQVATTLRLTQSMKRQLNAAVRRTVNAQKNPDSMLLQHTKHSTKSKSERNAAFEQLLQDLQNI